MKKIIKVVFTFVLAIGLVGCSDTNSNKENVDIEVKEELLNAIIHGSGLKNSSEDDVIEFLKLNGYEETDLSDGSDNDETNNVNHIYSKYNGDSSLFLILFGGGDNFDGEVFYTVLDSTEISEDYSSSEESFKDDLNNNGYTDALDIGGTENTTGVNYIIHNDETVELFRYDFSTGEYESDEKSGEELLSDSKIKASMDQMIDEIVEEFKTTFDYDLKK